MDKSGAQHPVVEVEGFTKHNPLRIIATDPVLYLDAEKRLVGELQSDVPSAVLAKWCDISPVTPQEVEAFAYELGIRFGNAVPPPQSFKMFRRTGIKPKPVMELRACGENSSSYAYMPRYAKLGEIIPFARISFIYDGTEIAYANEQTQISDRTGDEIHVIERNCELERRLVNSLKKFDLSRTKWIGSLKDQADLSMEDGREWGNFYSARLDDLKAAGWTIREDKSFPFTSAEADSYYEEWSEGEAAQWFEFETGFVVNGQRVSVLPALATFLNRHADEPLERLRGLLEQSGLSVSVGRRTALLPGKPLLPLLDSLFDLFTLDRNGNIPARLRLDGLRAAAINAQRGAQMPARLQELKERVRRGLAPKSIDAPEGFCATLREYQKLGNGWIKYLAEAGFGGVLADDMGLGKTVQTLAHILGEKRSGALSGPVLIVSPKSVVHNWEAEARRFAPMLKTLVLHGNERKAQFEQIDKSDLVLTTYPLIVRDIEEHKKRIYPLLVIDEAQNIKNARTKTYEAAVEINAIRRLALTGTPLENNLSELWALYSAVQPGLFPDQKLFNKHFRLPIEKGGDARRLAILRSRIAPFTLRRTKDAVLADLPPKTESITMVDLTERQVELYESVRAAMESRVRDAMAQRGLARSQIVVLDALLKLRQVCCDPRLLKTSAGAKSTAQHSAKLETLLEQIDELVAEGRHLLVFSQFVQMLDLIKVALDERKIQYLELTGQTENRAEIVETFQKGAIPVFLISLKAGGSGLNLTAADTVIHYDPWWNPAVENQATDRAHRIGQNKSVFVYKIITRGTVEEKILALQKKKSDLLAGILSDNPDPEKLGLTEEIVADLLSPLGDNGISG